MKFSDLKSKYRKKLSETRLLNLEEKLLQKEKFEFILN